MSGPDPELGQQRQVSSPPVDLTDLDDVLGLRIAAALVDLVLVAAVFVIMGLTIGDYDVAGGSFRVNLNGGAAIAFLAVVLLYYLTLETLTGQTVGKRLFGLRVCRAGQRAPVGAVAGRTLLRIVDWLPLMYLVGFIAMLASGRRRQRLGDLAAATSVVRAPVRNRGLALVSLAVVVLAALGLSVYRATGPDEPRTYRAHGVSFDYPARWHLQNSTLYASAGDQPLWKASVGPGSALDAVTVSAYQAGSPTTAANVDAKIPELETAVRQLFDQLGGAVLAGPERFTVDGLPAVRFGAFGMVNGDRISSTLVFVYDDTTAFEVECERSAPRDAEVQRACSQVLDSLRVHGAT